MYNPTSPYTIYIPTQYSSLHNIHPYSSLYHYSNSFPITPTYYNSLPPWKRVELWRIMLCIEYRVMHGLSSGPSIVLWWEDALNKSFTRVALTSILIWWVTYKIRYILFLTIHITIIKQLWRLAYTVLSNIPTKYIYMNIRDMSMDLANFSFKDGFSGI